MIFWLGLGNPRHIATKSPFCMVVVLGLKSWDWVRPPPSLGQNPNFDRKCFLGAPLNRSGKGIMCDMTETETETTLEMKRSPLAANLINLCRSTYSNFTGNNIHIFVEAQFSKEIIVAKKPKNFCCNGSS